MGTLAYNKMRCCQEMGYLLRISQEYDNNTKTIKNVLLNLIWEGKWKGNDLTSLGHKLTGLAAFCRLRNETIKFIFNCSQNGKVDSKVCKELPVIPDLTFLANFQEKLFTQIKESQFQVDICNAKVKQLREEVKATLIACGPCDLTDLLPYLEEGNQDQIAVLQTMLQWVYPNGKSRCNKNLVGSASSQKITDDQNTPSKSPNTSCDSTVLDTGILKSDSTKMDLEVQNRKQNPMPKKVIETKATTEASTESPNMSPDSNVLETEATSEVSTELPNMSPDSNVIETEAPKSDIITVDLKTQDTQLNPKQNPMPKKTQDTQLNPKQNPIPKETMTPRYKFKRIKKGGKVQNIQSLGVHKMKFKPSHRNKRIFWSKQLCYVNNVSHDSSSFALQNFYHMVTSNINGLHTVIHSQNMWLLRRPRVKIK